MDRTDDIYIVAAPPYARKLHTIISPHVTLSVIDRRQFFLEKKYY